MPTTRAARRAAAERQLLELPADVLALVLYQLTLAHDIAAVAPTCHALCDAAKLALKLRPFSGEVVTLAGHNDLVHGVAATPDGRIITGSYDRTVKVWRDGTCERTIQAHARDVEDVAVLPGGARFVSCADDGTAKLWTLDGILERTFQVTTQGIVWSVAALPDGMHFVVALGGGIGNALLKLYNVDGTLVHAFEGHIGTVFAVAVTLDGQHIISGATDRLVRVWSVATKSLVSTCRGHTRPLKAVAAMPDGQRFLSGGYDSTVRVWLLDGTLKNTFELHTDAVAALVAMPDNQHALSGSKDRTVKLFNVNDGAVLRTFWHHTDAVGCLALLPDGIRFFSGAWDNTAEIVEIGLAPLAG
jgi:WD40 repeat protein